ncbi:MAG: penicillin acylase family protein [Candidatus Odinarchaeota archaeon]
MDKKKLAYLLSVLILTTILSITPVYAYPYSYDRITILRDDYGVPHIFARTKEGLGFGCGYAMAQDRLWQAEVYRRNAFGSLAEIGLAPIESDLQTRTVGYSRAELLEIFNKWNPTKPEAKLKEMLLAYVDGVNAYINEALLALSMGDLSKIPIEYLAFGFLPEPWTIEDSVAVMSMMAWRFGGCGGDELSYLAALEALIDRYGEEIGWGIFNDHFPQNDPGAEVSIRGECCGEVNWFTDYSCEDCGVLGISSNINEVWNTYEEAQMGQTELFESLGIPTSFGSNAWIVNPCKSESGNALQVGGPQMGQTIPQIVMEVGLHGAGINAVGMMMPMAPSILIGVSTSGAWTSTTGVSDVMDTYIEVLNPDNHNQYLYNGEWKDMEVRTERIYGLGKAYYVDFDIRRTIHGPIIGEDEENHLAFTLKTPYYLNDLEAEEGWQLFQQAKTHWDFFDACATVQPAHNFYWADRYGNIAYCHSGYFPIKPETGKEGRIIDDRFPLWGTGEEEWVGVTGFDEMPKCLNPEEGFLANWNNKPIANWPYGESDAGWGEGHRVKRIQDLLSMKDKITLEDMKSINMDAGYNHIPAMSVLDDLIAAASVSADPDIQAALPYLQAWNHHYNDYELPRWPDPAATYDDPGLTIFDAWYDRIFDVVFEDDLPPYAEVGPIHREYASVWPSTLIHVFDGPASKLPLYFDYLNGVDKNVVINRALKWAIGNLTDDLGPDMDTWLTPVRTTWFGAQGALPSPVMHSMNRGTYNQVVEMIKTRGWSVWDDTTNAMNVIPPGQSGFMNGYMEYSPHAYDQLILYETWTYKPMRYDYFDIRSVAESMKFLRYYL